MRNYRTGYNRSRQREYEVKKQFEKEKWYAVRGAGSHGLADVLVVRPTACGNPSHFEVRFIQIKTSRNLKKDSKKIKVEEAPFGAVNVEYWSYAVKTYVADRKSNKTEESRQTNKARKGV